ncbi:DUF6978 family protein [Staphylococcus simulans]
MKNLNLNNLTSEQVLILIKELKISLSQINIYLLKVKMVKPLNIRQTIVSLDSHIHYVLFIKKGMRDPDRFTIILLFKGIGHTLVRIDINGGNHLNPDHSIAPKSHIHIYNNQFEKKDRYAYALNPSDFPNISTLYPVYLSFLRFNNIDRK